MRLFTSPHSLVSVLSLVQHLDIYNMHWIWPVNSLYFSFFCNKIKESKTNLLQECHSLQHASVTFWNLLWILGCHCTITTTKLHSFKVHCVCLILSSGFVHAPCDYFFIELRVLFPWHSLKLLCALFLFLKFIWGMLFNFSSLEFSFMFIFIVHVFCSLYSFFMAKMSF